MEIFVPIIPTNYYSPPQFSSRCGLRHRRNAPVVRRFSNNVSPASRNGWLSPADILHYILGSSDSTNSTDKQQQTAQNAVVKNNMFEVKLNVNEYKPEELNVKIADGMVTIEGNHEESKINNENSKDNIHDEEFISRRFKKSFKLPENIIEEKLECQLSTDGQLIVTAPFRAVEPPAPESVRSIPINIINSEVDKKIQTAETNTVVDENEKMKVDPTSSEAIPA